LNFRRLRPDSAFVVRGERLLMRSRERFFLAAAVLHSNVLTVLNWEMDAVRLTCILDNVYETDVDCRIVCDFS
jgi:hypothetical protein